MKNQNHTILINYSVKYLRYLTLTITFLCQALTYAQQNNASPNITVTDESGNESVLVNCDYPYDENRCFKLKANYSVINESTSYEVEAITYKNPIANASSNTIIEVSGDDKWSKPLNLPFEFCFFDNNYNTFTLGDNGIITFDTPSEGTDCQFIKAKLPSGNLPGNAIFGVFHDMVNVNIEGCKDNPNTPVNECGEIKLYTIGTAPQRQFIISYEDMNHFACENVKSTSQIVLYETSNVIDVYVNKKPINCEVINPNDDPDVVIGIENRKNALIGIQNKKKDKAHFPENRNNTEWSTTNEAWRFTPDGKSVTTVKWRDNSGNYIAEGDSITICPEEATTYSAEVTYNVCIGDPIIIDDVIDIAIAVDFPVAKKVKEAVCDIVEYKLPPNLKGQERVNLLDYAKQIKGEQEGTLTFHTTLNAAKNNTDAINNIIAKNYLIKGNTTLYTRVQKGNNGNCFDVNTLELNLIEKGTSNLKNISVCDIVSDTNKEGEEEINVTDYNNAILNGQSGININYYDKNNNEITGKITVKNGDSISVKLTVGDKGLCENIEKLPIILNEKPLDLKLEKEFCDDLITYDLTQHEPEIIQANTNINTNGLQFTYYQTKNDALNKNNPIGKIDKNGKPDERGTPDKYLLKNKSGNIKIYIRLENETTGCFGIVELTLIPKEGVPVNDAEQIQTQNPFDLTKSLLDMLEDIDISKVDYTFYTCGEGQPHDTIPKDAIKIYQAKNPEEKICVLFTHLETGCKSNGNLDITLLGGGGSGGGGSLGACDLDNNGEESFILFDFDETIIQRTDFERKELLEVNYYETEKQANNASNPINKEQPYSITGNKTLYVRISVLDQNKKEIDHWVTEILLEFRKTYEFNAIEDVICDLEYDNKEYVDLTQYEEAIVENVMAKSECTFTYYKGDAKIEDPVKYNFIGPEQEITVIVTTPNGCGNPTTITLTFEPKIEAENAMLEACDYNNDNEENFDLNDAIPNIYKNTVTLSEHKFLFYNTLNDAKKDTLAITDSKNQIVNTDSKQFFVRVEKNESGCYTVKKLDVFVRDAPEYKTTQLELCDFENDGIENEVNLSQFNTTITGTSKTSIQYFKNEKDTIPITTATIKNGTVLYTKLTSYAICDNQSPITFNLIKTPEVTNIDIEVCDNLEDNLEEYNLLQHETTIVSNTKNKTITYHNSFEGAQNNTNRILTPAFYKITEAPQTVFVRIVDSVTGCYSIAKINISFITPTPTKDVKIETCDKHGDGSEIFDATAQLNEAIANPENFTVSYYSSMDGAINADDSLKIKTPKTVDSANNSIIYIRFDDENTGCFSISTLSLVLKKPPKLLPGTHEICDIDLDGDYVLNLTELNGVVIQNTTNLKFSYHLTYEDADENKNAITDFKTYTVPKFPHRVFLRVESENGCFSVSSVDINKRDQVQVNKVTEPLQACDDDFDDYALFDITSFEPLLTPESNATFSYFTSLNDANANINAITTPSNYKNTTPLEQQLFARVHVDGKCDDVTPFTIQTLAIRPNLEDATFCDGNTATLNAGSGYASYLWSTGETTQTITVNTPGKYTITLTNTFGCENTFNVNATKIDTPNVNNVNRVVCDDANVDSKVIFNLNDIIPEVTNNDTTTFSHFYLTQEDAEAEKNELTNLENFKNTSNPQTVYIKVYEATKQCYSYATFTIRVSAVKLNPALLEVCDEIDSEDGISTFNLKNAEGQILNNLPTTVVSYHKTKQDALNDSNRLPLEYTNTTAYNETIYSRIINEDGCVSVGTINLVVNKLPNVKKSKALYCLNTYPDTLPLDGVENDNLSNYTYLWSTGETTPTIQINKTGTYSVEVTNQKGCSKSRTIEVVGSDIAKIETIEIGDKSNIDSITIIASGISEYDYSLDGSTYQDSNVFENIEPGVYTIYVRDKIGNCGVVTDIVAVLGFPPFFSPNGDGYNDTWHPKGYSPDVHTNMTISVFDRYGKLLHNINLESENGWDGFYRGALLPGTDYWYKATYTESFSGKHREFTGHFSLRR